MARLDDIPAAERRVIENLSLPTYETTPFVRGLPLAERRVALVSTAGLQRRGDRPFGVSAGDYRVIPSSVAADDLVMSHASPNFDHIKSCLDFVVIEHQRAKNITLKLHVISI